MMSRDDIVMILKWNILKLLKIVQKTVKFYGHFRMSKNWNKMKTFWNKMRTVRSENHGSHLVPKISRFVPKIVMPSSNFCKFPKMTVKLCQLI